MEPGTKVLVPLRDPPVAATVISWEDYFAARPYMVEKLTAADREVSVPIRWDNGKVTFWGKAHLAAIEKFAKAR